LINRASLHFYTNILPSDWRKETEDGEKFSLKVATYLLVDE
jgi:hypothetical protein